MYIPYRLPGTTFDLSRVSRGTVAPVAGTAGVAATAGNGSGTTVAFPPGARDVGNDLERLLTRLAPDSAGRTSRGTLDLNLGEFGAPTTLSSTGELNSAVTSYDKVQLDFGGSSSVGSLKGTLAATGAAAGVTNLRFEIQSTTTLGSSKSPLKFQVLREDGTALFSFDGSAKAGDQISLGADIGLSISFSRGTLRAGDVGNTGASTYTPTKVDVDAVFDDPDPNSRPRFEAGAQVTAGSFLVNGTRIEVRADDSISAVLQRISENVPDVTATYADDRVQLSTRSNTNQPIVLGDDTSGFLDATKLTGAASIVGHAPEDTVRLADLPQFAAVRAGSFRVGGATISIDPSTDSLASVLAKINQSADGVSAAYDDQAQAVVLEGPSDSAVTLGDDTSGFLSAVGLATGSQPSASSRLQLAPGLAQSLQQGVAGRLSDLLSSAAADSTSEIATAAKARSAYTKPAVDAQAQAKATQAAERRDEASALEARAAREANASATAASPTSTTTSPTDTQGAARRASAAVASYARSASDSARATEETARADRARAEWLQASARTEQQAADQQARANAADRVNPPRDGGGRSVSDGASSEAPLRGVRWRPPAVTADSAAAPA